MTNKAVAKNIPLEKISIEEYISFKGIYRATVHLTDKCNLGCLYCGFDSGRGKTTELPLNIVRKIIHSLSKFEVRHLDLSGGDSTLREDIFEILTEIDRTPMSFSLLTNGTLISPSFAEKLGQHTLHSVKISIDGLEEVHDRLRGIGNFERALLGLKNVIERTDIPTKVMFTLSSYNGKDISELALMMANLGVWRLVIRLCDANGRSDKTYIPSSFLIEKVYRDILKISNDLPDDFIELSFVNPFPKLRIWANNPYCMVEDSGRHIIIMTNGDVIADYSRYLECIRTNLDVNDGKEGNLYTQNLDVLIQSIINRVSV